MTFDQAAERLAMLGRQNGGVLTAARVERDPELASADRDVVRAAARALDGTTNVFGSPRTSEGWFPFEELRFTVL
jgi:hypothetical protein